MGFRRVFLAVQSVAVALALFFLCGCENQDFKVTINVSPVEEAGAVALSPARDAYAHGEKVTLHIVPGDGWRFKAWGGDYIGMDAAPTISVTKNMHITANLVEVADTGQDSGNTETDDVDDGGEAPDVSIEGENDISFEDEDLPEDAETSDIDKPEIEDEADASDGLEDDGERDTLQQTEPPFELTLAPDEWVVDYTSGQVIYVITTEASWVADITLNNMNAIRWAYFLYEGDELDQVEGAGTFILTVGYQENTTGASREADVIVTGEDTTPEQVGARLVQQPHDVEGEIEGEIEGEPEGEPEGEVEGEIEGEIEGEPEGEVEGEIEGEIEGEGEPEGEIDYLKRYIAYDDGCFGYSFPIKQPYQVAGQTVADVYVINRMRSQCWNPDGYVYDGEKWVHPVVIINPVLRVTNTALLFIDGGSRTSTAQVEPALLQIALLSGTPVVHIKNIPSQPIVFWDEVVEPDEEDNYSGDDFVLRRRSEDAAIAYSYDKYLQSWLPPGDLKQGTTQSAPPPVEWPLLFPMVKAAVRAMDVAQDVLRSDGAPITDFVVSGASKRGWTTWLTGAADTRVKAVAPIVINVLNMKPHLTHHRNAYGYWSPAIYDYAQKGVFDQLVGDVAPEARALLELVDPYEYALRGGYMMPIFMLNATGDEFFVPDRGADDDHLEVLSSFGDPRQSFVPNVGHGMGGLDSDADLTNPENPVGMFLAWYMAVVQNRPLPAFSWQFDRDGAIRVTIDPANPPVRARMWRATSPGKRDFRNHVLGPRWIASELWLHPDGVSYRAKPSEPRPGDYTAFFVQLEYENAAQLPPGLGMLPLPDMNIAVPNLVFSTPVRVLPVDGTGDPTYPAYDGYNANVERPDAVLFDDGKLPMSVVYGSPYQMGNYYGQLMADRIQAFENDFMAGADENLLDMYWETVEGGLDPRLVDEISGIADGAGMGLVRVQRMHAQAMMHLSDIFTSAGVAAYREMIVGRDSLHTVTFNAMDGMSKALVDNYWEDHLCAVMYVPEKGVPHVLMTFAGLAVGLTGVNLGGVSIHEVVEPATIGGESALPLMREILFDALGLRDAVDKINEAALERQTTFVIADGRNERRAASVRTSMTGAMPEVRYDLAKSDFRIQRPGIIYHAENAARLTLRQLLQPRLQNLVRNDLLTIAGTVPTAMTGYNVLNVAFEFNGSHVTVYVAAAQSGQEAYQDYFEQIFMQRLLP